MGSLGSFRNIACTKGVNMSLLVKKNAARNLQGLEAFAARNMFDVVHGSLNVPIFHITQPLGIWSIMAIQYSQNGTFTNPCCQPTNSCMTYNDLTSWRWLEWWLYSREITRNHRGTLGAASLGWSCTRIDVFGGVDARKSRKTML